MTVFMMEKSTLDQIRSLSDDGALAVRRRSRQDLGSILVSAQSAERIAGVEIESGQLWPDDRGVFTELFRMGASSLTAGFTGAIQISAALSFPGTIKAIHFHRHQTDLWAPVKGSFQVALFDLRTESPTFGAVNTLYLGEWRPWRLRIPPGVGHGYKVLGEETGLLVYATDHYYDPADEGRLNWNDPDLKYDWETQKK